MTIGTIMFYGGIIGAAVGGILFLVLIQVFREERQHLKDEFHEKETQIIMKNKT